MVLAFFRRQTTEVTRVSLLPKREQPHRINPDTTYPGRFLAIILAVLVCIFLGYLGLQYSKINLPPALKVDAPPYSANGYYTSDPQIDVIGSTDPDATVTVNGQLITLSPNGDGKFFDQRSLIPA